MDQIDPKQAPDEKSAKLYQMILDYNLSKEDFFILEMIKNKTCEEIDKKYNSSHINSHYSFPRTFKKQQIKNNQEQYSDSDSDSLSSLNQDVVNLYDQNNKFTNIKSSVKSNQKVDAIISSDKKMSTQSSINHKQKNKERDNYYSSTNLNTYQNKSELIDSMQQQQDQEFQNKVNVQENELTHRKNDIQNLLDHVEISSFQNQEFIDSEQNETCEIVYEDKSSKGNTSNKLYLNFYDNKIKITNKK